MATDKHHLLIDRLRNLAKHLQGAGADHEEALMLASAMVARWAEMIEPQSWLQLKQKCEPYTYPYTKLIIAHVDIEKTSSGKRQLCLIVESLVGHDTKAEKFLGPTALRLFTLLVQKFSAFEDDVTLGFDNRTLETVDDSVAKQHSLTMDFRTSESLHESINDQFEGKFRQKLAIQNLQKAPAPGQYRLGYSPSRISFKTESTREIFETLSTGAYQTFSDTYSFYPSR